MRQRHSLRQLLLRGAVAAVGGVGIATGVYPVGAQIGTALARLRAGRRQPDGLAKIVAREWALSLAFQAARPVGLLGNPVVGPQASGPRPVVVLHGFAQGQANFLVLAHRLKRAGIGPILGFEYWTLGRVVRAAGDLARFVDAIRRETGAPRVDVIGHSMGGVVSRLFALEHGDAVENLVTIGSPHLGTPISRFGVGWPVVELAVSSKLLQELDARPLAPHVKMTCIWSRADGLVSSPRHAQANGAEEIVFDDLGHMSLLASRRVGAEVTARLKL